MELTWAVIDAFNRGDREWLLERIDDDFEFDWTRSRGPLAGIYRAGTDSPSFLREQWETFESFHMEATDFINRGHQVVVPDTVHAQGRNGIEVSAEASHVFTLEPTAVSRA